MSVRESLRGSESDNLGLNCRFGVSYVSFIEMMVITAKIAVVINIIQFVTSDANDHLDPKR